MPRGRAGTLLGLAALVAASALLRARGLHAGFWTDEAIAAGVAARPLADIPATLRLDGSPPLFYVLLHGWTAVAGDTEAAARGLSLALALLTVPVALWAGTAIAGRRAGWLAAAGAAGLPFLTRYAAEARMYTLVALLSLVATAAFVLVVARRRRRHLLTLVLALAALLWTHNWGLFLLAGITGTWLVLALAGRARAGEALGAAAAVAVIYAPWVPSLLFQVRHTAAPWAAPPGVPRLLAAPAVLLGPAVAVLLLPALVAGRHRLRGLGPAAHLPLAPGALTAALAFAASQASPAWAGRYLAVLVGPALLAGAVVAARGGRRTGAVLAAVALLWALVPAPAVKSNARLLAATAAPLLRPGDRVLVAGPQHVPMLARELPAGLRWATPAGPVADTAVTDWRDLVARLRAADARRAARAAVRGLAPGGHVVLARPLPAGPPRAPLLRLVRDRGRELQVALAGDERLRLVRRVPGARADGPATQLQLSVYERVRRPGVPR